MKYGSQKSIPFKIDLLLIACWCTVILLLGNISRLGFSGWFSFLYVPACILVVYFLGVVYRPPKNDSSIIGIPLYYSVVLRMLAIVINAAYIFAGIPQLGPVVIAVDIILLAGYIGIVFFSTLYQRSLPAKTKKLQSNMSFSSTVSRTLGGLLAEADDPDILKALTSLKEKVDYSTNSSQSAVDEPEILSALNGLQEMISGSADKEEIISAVSRVGNLWKARNTKL